jgi:hypothetical protein
VVSLDNDPEFDALPYACWAPGEALDFACSGEVLSKHKNLGNFLQLTSARGHQRSIWIDAVCINQKDDADKTIKYHSRVRSTARRPKFSSG